MDKTEESKAIVPVFTFFIAVSGFCTLFKTWLAEKNIDPLVIGFGNLLLFILSLAVFSLHKKALQNANPQVAVRSVMLGSFIKLMVIAVAVLIYLLASGDKRSIYGIFGFLFLYVIYTVLDTRIASKLKRTNGGS